MATSFDEYLDALERSGGVSMGPAPSRAEEAARQRQMQQTRSQLEASVSPMATAVGISPPVNGQTSIPAMLGMIGGVLPFAAPEARLSRLFGQAAKIAPAPIRPYAQSLFGSTAGTSLGVAVESPLVGRELLSQETGRRLIAENITNAAFDIGGNLTFHLAGQAYKVSKPALEKFGLKIPGFTNDPDLARKSAQTWLAQRDATLTKGQLTGDVGLQQMEAGIGLVPSAADVIAGQRQKVTEAIEKGKQEVLSSLDVSPEFKMALTREDPTEMAVGQRWQNTIDAAQKAMKDKFRPVYVSLDSQSNAIKVDLTGLKSIAQARYNKLAESKFAGSSNEKSILEDILKQDDSVSFSTAHDLRSNLLASARDAEQPGKATTTVERTYKLFADRLGKTMDTSAQAILFTNKEEKELARKLGITGGLDAKGGLREGQYLSSIDDPQKFLETSGYTPANFKNYDLIREYWNAQNGYANAMKGFYGGVMQSALKESPSNVGKILFDVDKPETIKSAQQAMVEARKYLPASQADGLVDELRYGYLSKAFENPESIKKFSANLDKPEFMKNFAYMFNPTQTKQIKELLNAAKYGMETETGPSTFRTIMASKTAKVATGAIAGGLTIGIAGNSQLENLPQNMLEAGVLIVTPRMFAKALTNKEAMNALAGLSKLQTKPKFGGALGAKLINQLNESGVIDLGYKDDVNKLLYGDQTGGKQAPAMSFDEYLNQQQSQQE